MRGLIFSMIVAAAGGQALAQDSKAWGEEGKWAILVDPTTGNGCYAERQFADGTLVQVGAVPNRAGGFFAAYHADWTDIEAGSTGTVKFDFGSEKFAGEAEGRVLGALHGGYAFFDNPNFVTEFAGRKSVTVSGESGREIKIDLSGTSRAIRAVRSCQEQQPKSE